MFFQEGSFKSGRTALCKIFLFPAAVEAVGGRRLSPCKALQDIQ
jgi:hypothetical protein